MARRRLLTILAASAVLGAAITGPAAAADLTSTTQEPVSEATAETVGASEVAQTGAAAVEATAQAVEDAAESVAPEPVAEAAGTATEAVAPEPSPSPSDDPSPSGSDGSTQDEAGETVVAAGDVTTAPSLAFLTGTGGSAPATSSQADLTLPPMPTVTGALRTGEDVEAPQVAPALTAPAPAADTPAALAQSVRSAADEDGAPTMLLVAIASLLAAGFGTVRGSRAGATATTATTA